ncbi:hypothetical protein LEP1GSC199_3972 [Leptospira vanthielii serovar Holland str. Waz Holland = ATCC 700522]|uniref:Uncharacterized protein n=1 Tax=Leptospira vanthielii serovar Holland str. Waz Holland = ATCC 700522 TaxID=1218591 RepID=N1WFZ8_9LEPT|nr:hypothetical protein LEP1GSC199_3972 [Leptospira vanthielii serovar Holland str. Waz Holland = ATCC 700522]
MLLVEDLVPLYRNLVWAGKEFAHPSLRHPGFVRSGPSSLFSASCGNFSFHPCLSSTTNRAYAFYKSFAGSKSSSSIRILHWLLVGDFVPLNRNLVWAGKDFAHPSLRHPGFVRAGPSSLFSASCGNFSLWVEVELLYSNPSIGC